MPDRVTIGVPVYRGEPFLREALCSIQAQTHKNFEVVMSLDGPDPACEAICRSFQGDARFRLVVHPARLGWVGQFNWLLTQVTGEFWYFHQQDDLTAPTYLEVLLDHARRYPEAALVYCDLTPFGRIEGGFTPHASVTGPTPYLRQLATLHQIVNAYAFRGLTRAGAVRRAGPVPTDGVANFGADLCWLAAVALAGEVRRVPIELYRKRYHDRNTESEWWAWDRAHRLRAWPAHCAEMAHQALRAETTVHEARLLWLAAIERLTSPQVAGHFVPISTVTDVERAQMLDAFLARARTAGVADVPLSLDADWPAIDDMSRAFFRDSGCTPIEIVDYGPVTVRRGQPFNVQPDGRSALWVRASRGALSDVSIHLGGRMLDTYRDGAVFTAFVPAELTERAGQVELVLVGPDGRARSANVAVEVV